MTCNACSWCDASIANAPLQVFVIGIWSLSMSWKPIQLSPACSSFDLLAATVGSLQSQSASKELHCSGTSVTLRYIFHFSPPSRRTCEKTMPLLPIWECCALQQQLILSFGIIIDRTCREHELLRFLGESTILIGRFTYWNHNCRRTCTSLLISVSCWGCYTRCLRLHVSVNFVSSSF